MVKSTPLGFWFGFLAGCVGLGAFSIAATAQETLPWAQNQYSDRYNGHRQDYQQPYEPRYRSAPPYHQVQSAPNPYGAEPPANRYDYGQPSQPPRVYNDRAASPEYRPPAQSYPQRSPAPAYQQPQPRYVKPYRDPRQEPYQRRYGSNEPYDPNYGNDGRYRDKPARMPSTSGTYSQNEVIDAGHRFFGSLSKGLAKAVQWAFKSSGRPNGYILGEDAGGAFVAGLRYGEGKLYTKNYGVRRVFWQGPSLGYDFGGDGNRTMTLVYNLRSPHDIYRRFGGVQGAAYLVGGVSVQLLRGSDDVTLAPIRTGVGVRLGANIGYLKYTRRPTWNPF